MPWKCSTNARSSLSMLIVNILSVTSPTTFRTGIARIYRSLLLHLSGSRKLPFWCFLYHRETIRQWSSLCIHLLSVRKVAALFHSIVGPWPMVIFRTTLFWLSLCCWNCAKLAVCHGWTSVLYSIWNSGYVSCAWTPTVCKVDAYPTRSLRDKWRTICLPTKYNIGRISASVSKVYRIFSKPYFG